MSHLILYSLKRADHILMPSAAGVLVYIGGRNAEGITTTINDVVGNVYFARGTILNCTEDFSRMGLLKGAYGHYTLTEQGEKWYEHYKPIVDGDAFLSRGEVDFLLHLYDYEQNNQPAYMPTSRITSDFLARGIVESARRNGRVTYHLTTDDWRKLAEHYKALLDLGKQLSIV